MIQIYNCVRQVQPVVEEVRPESPEKIDQVPTESTQEEEITVVMSTTEAEEQAQSQVCDSCCLTGVVEFSQVFFT